MRFRLIIDPADTIAISDGRPFNQADAGRAISASVFPPPPNTLYGAARVACARALGWRGYGNWSKKNPEIVGTMGSQDTPGQFKISGPFFRAGENDLLPLPSHAVLRREGVKTQIILRTPHSEDTKTDLGEVPLPFVSPYQQGVSYKRLDGRWGRADAVVRLLAGETVHPDDLGRPKELGWPEPCNNLALPNRPQSLPGWSLCDLAAEEYRVGIARVPDTHLAADGQLYASVRRAVRQDVQMFVEVEGLDPPKDMNIAVPFGGEARFAFISNDNRQLPGMPSSVQGNYLIYLATPTVLSAMAADHDLQPTADSNESSADQRRPISELEAWETLLDLPGKLVMASVNGVTTHAGRENNADGKGTRSKAKAVLPAGSVLFMQANGEVTLTSERLGEETHMGYGRYIAGVWE